MKQYLLLLFALLVLFSCKKSTYEPPQITAETISGKWVVVSYSYKVWREGKLIIDSINDGLGEEFEYIPQNTVIYHTSKGLEVPGSYKIYYESGKYYYNTEIPGTQGALNSGVGEIQLIDKNSFQVAFLRPGYNTKERRTVFTQTLKRK